MTDREAMQLALHALELEATNQPLPETAAAMSALRARLAEPEQEPVAWMDREGDIYPMPERTGWAPPHTLLYAHPPTRRPLTDEEIDKLPWEPSQGNPMTFTEGLRNFARAIEAAHGIETTNG